MADSNKGDNDKKEISNLGDNIVMLDITPSVTPTIPSYSSHQSLSNTSNTNINNADNVLWICSMCTYKNHQLLKQCAMCDTNVTDKCEWVKNKISINNTDSTDSKMSHNISADTTIPNTATVNAKANRKRQRTYMDETSLAKKQKLSNDKLENDIEENNIKNEYDANIKLLPQMEQQKIRQKYKEKESMLQKQHKKETQRLQNEIKSLKKENAMLLTQNIKYQTTQQLLQRILNGDIIEQKNKSNMMEADDIESKSMDICDTEQNINVEENSNTRLNPVDQLSRDIDNVPSDNHNNKNNSIARLSAADYGFEDHENHNNCLTEKPFQCRYCPKRFKTKSHSNYHELTHSTAIQYQCKPCGAQFTRKEYYQQHLGTQKHKANEKEERLSTNTPAYTKEQKKDAENEIDF